jgi:hypothetical protein
MNAKLVDSLVQIIQTLTVDERKKLDTKLSTLTQDNKSAKRSIQFQQWDRISDPDAAALKAEFTQEDLIFAETILPEYSSNLQTEDRP